MSERPLPLTRSDFRHFHRIETRWSDNDGYGHVNNIYYYSFFDTAVTEFLIGNGLLDFRNGTAVGLVVESQCNYFESLAFPGPVAIGLRVGHIGSSSVRYELGAFAADADVTAALGHFVHVYVDRASRKPIVLGDHFRSVMQKIAA